MLNTVNRQRRDLQFQVGDLVLLSTANLKLSLGTKRVKTFAPKLIGPFLKFSNALQMGEHTE
jgi:hypothetical protein